MPRPLSQAARQKALDAAADLVAVVGIEGFTVDEVARRSGVAKTTLYRHWSSGNELMMAALDCHIETISTPDTGSLRNDLLQLYETMRTTVATESNRQLMADMLAAATRDPELEQITAAMVAERLQPLADIVGRAVERGEIPPTDPARAALFIHGPFMARTLLRPEAIGADEVVRLIDLIVDGLTGPPDPRP